MLRLTAMIITALALVTLTVPPALAYLDCGRVQRHYFGISNPRYNLAKAWLDFRHTVAHPGAVVVQTRRGRDSAGHPGGHVSRIVRMTGQCSAIVTDESGTYNRDICSRLLAYVDPNGNAVSRYAARVRHQVTHHRRHYRYAARRGTQYAYAAPTDRLTPR